MLIVVKARLASSVLFQQKALYFDYSSRSGGSGGIVRSLQDGGKSVREYLTENNLILKQTSDSNTFLQVKGDMNAILHILVSLTHHSSIHSVSQLSIPKLHGHSRTLLHIL